MNDGSNVPLWKQNRSILWKLDKNEHVKLNLESSFTLNSFDELKLDWNVIVFRLLNLSNNVDDEQPLTLIINKY